jgi:CDP-paratose 2-epimerase
MIGDGMKVVITGGAGFIGINVAKHLCALQYTVVILDDLSRIGSQENLEWLTAYHEVGFENCDIRDALAVHESLGRHRDAIAIVHLAAQVGVPKSQEDPMNDYRVNADGTLNVLEAMRLTDMRAVMIFASTNKVYGDLSDAQLVEGLTRYSYVSESNGIGESRNLHFCTPYGCSKGAADQYVLDYHRTFGLNTVVLRPSCVCGPRQWGSEDQGWVAWLAIAHAFGIPIAIYGDGKQVRDILHVNDLCRLIEMIIRAPQNVVGRAYNIGGGPRNSISLIELMQFLSQRSGRQVAYVFKSWRKADQKIYISDTTRVECDLGWKPKIGKIEAIEDVLGWVESNAEQLQRVLQGIYVKGGVKPDQCGGVKVDQ